MTDRSNDRASFVTLAVVLVALTLGNLIFFEKWQQSEATIARQNAHLEQVVKDLTKEKTDVEATLAECNAALASVQAKPTPAPVTCRAPLPVPACPPAPAPIITPEPHECPPMPVCPLPAPAPAVAPTPEPARIVQHYYFHTHLHRKHHLAPVPCCKCEWKRDN